MIRVDLLYRHGVASLLVFVLMSVVFDVNAAPTIHSADVLSLHNDYCPYCHLDSPAPDPLMPKIWRGEEQSPCASPVTILPVSPRPRAKWPCTG